uniref:Uncharacterized protein n=3 Tax=Avena sativa TaxID=4498 RepID=A0ACD5XHA5_AVESA
MAEASREAHLRPDLPEEIVVWEILVRLPPKSLFRCRAVCRSWRSATSARPFLLAQHGRQPNLPIISGSEYGEDTHYKDFLPFDHRAADAQLHAVARLDGSFNLEASCDGLFVLPKRGAIGTCFCVCNPVSREHAPLGAPWDFSIFRLLGMYRHRPTGEYRLVLHRSRCTESIVGPLLLPKGKTGCYVIGCYNDAMEVVDIWVLQNYEGEVWVLGYNVKLPVEQIRGQFGCWNDDSYATIVSVHGDVFLQVSHGGWVLHVDTDGELIGSFHRGGQRISACDLCFKQTLVPHNFFMALEGYAVTAPPFL